MLQRLPCFSDASINSAFFVCSRRTFEGVSVSVQATGWVRGKGTDSIRHRHVESGVLHRWTG
jgi:hypothetical protein